LGYVGVKKNQTQESETKTIEHVYNGMFFNSLGKRYIARCDSERWRDEEFHGGSLALPILVIRGCTIISVIKIIKTG
jgi:hypothetical protein